MSKRKEHVFVDVITILLCLFPLLMGLATAIFNGSFEFNDFATFVSQFSISNDLAQKIGSAINTFGIVFDGAFFNSACVLMSNTLIIYLFRVFVSVMVFIPKMASKFINLDFGGKV